MSNSKKSCNLKRMVYCMRENIMMLVMQSARATMLVSNKYIKKVSTDIYL